MMLETSSFYLKQSEELLKKINNAKSQEEKAAFLKDLICLKNKISFEINEINKILEDNQ